MKLQEIEVENLIGKWIKCYKWIEPNCEDIVYQLDIPDEIYTEVLKQIVSVKSFIVSNSIFYHLKFETGDLDAWGENEIELHNNNNKYEIK